MRPISRRAIPCLIAAALTLSLGGLAGCASKGGQSMPFTGGNATEAAGTEGDSASEPVAAVTSSDYFNLDGAYLDTSYVDPNGSNGQMLYVFHTLTAPDSGLQTSSNSMQLRVCDEEAARSGNASAGERIFANMDASGDLMTSYYYDNVIETVQYGNEFKMVSTFLVSPAQMEAGHFLLFKDDDVPGLDSIIVPTESVVACSSPEEIAEIADPAGVEAARAAHEPADEATVQAVNDAINFYEFYTIYGGLNLKFYFEAPNYFEERTTGQGNSGTYEVQQGYIACTYDNGNTVDIPWEWKEDGSISLDIANGVGL